KLVQRQAREDSDSIRQCPARLGKRLALSSIATLDHSGIGNAPMGGHGLARPYRTDLAGRVVANRDDEIELWGARLGELVPILAAQAVGRHPVLLQQLQRERIHSARGMRASTESAEATSTHLAQEGHRHAATGGVPGAEEQDVVDPP